MAVRVVEGSIVGAEFYDFVLNDVVSRCMLPVLTKLGSATQHEPVSGA